MTEERSAEVAVIGGTGVYDPEIIEDAREVKVYTPYGAPSDLVTLGVYGGRDIAFIPRHGRGHQIPPHRINNRANIWALKELGVERIVASSAVGSLREDYGPGDFVLTEQFIDRTKKRLDTFYEGANSATSPPPTPSAPSSTASSWTTPSGWASGSTRLGPTSASRGLGSPPGRSPGCSANGGPTSSG